ncbi:hypothetical protein Trydic_g17486 [Trypoxylus dichotomus]
MVRFCQIAEPSATFAIVCLFFLRPSFNATYLFPMYTAVPESFVFDAVLCLCQFYSIGIGILIIAICDLTYLALCVHMVVQTRLLRFRLERVIRRRDDSFEGGIKLCISYHHFLLTTFSQMQRIYSALFLLHYFVTIFTTCSNLFVLARNANLTTNTTELLCILFLILQFASYTFLADQVAFKLSDVSDAIYESKWYDKGSLIQNMLRIVMLGSQRTRYFSGAGLMDINMETFAMATIVFSPVSAHPSYKTLPNILYTKAETIFFIVVFYLSHLSLRYVWVTTTKALMQYLDYRYLKAKIMEKIQGTCNRARQIWKKIVGIPLYSIWKPVSIVGGYYTACLEPDAVLEVLCTYFSFNIRVTLEQRQLERKTRNALKRYFSSNFELSTISNFLRRHHFLHTLLSRMERLHSFVLLFHYPESVYKDCSAIFDPIIRFFIGQLSCCSLPNGQGFSEVSCL